MASGTYDIITVGGGMGGSSLAKVMAEKGARVLVLEREKKFKDRVRGEAMPSWGTAEAQELGIYELLRTTCGHEMPWLDIYLGPTRIAHRDVVATTPKHTPFSSFYHPAMQEVLLHAAAEAGAEVRREARVRDVQPGVSPKVVIEQDGRVEEIRARLVVGADGRGSMARKWGGFSVRRDPEHLLISGVLFKGMSASQDTACLILNPDIGQTTFLFPQGQDQVRAYIVYQKDTNYRLQGKEDVPRFVGESVRAGAPAEFYAEAKAIGPLATFDGADSWVEHPYKDGLALIGDAGAASDPTWGEGLSLVMRDVRVLRDNLLSYDDWDAAGHAYAEEHDRHYGVIHTLDNWLSEFFLTLSPEAEARRAKALPLIAQDGSRIPDLFGLGPEATVDEIARRRLFGEE